MLVDVLLLKELNMTHWVWRPDGAIQCFDKAGESLEDAHADLAQRIGSRNILDSTQLSRPVIAMCGAPSGVMNAFLITERGFRLLFDGIAGPGGFSECDPEVNFPAQIRAAGEADLSDIVTGTDISSARNNPVLVRELIGRPVRVYEFGNVVTGDYVADRVNIVTLKGRIQDIRFG
jgi:hypothetical protein